MLRLLKLEDQMVLDQILDNWEVYASGSIEDIFERTVNDLHDLYDMTYRDSDEGIRLQCLLGEFQNELAECMKHTTIRLLQVLDHIPDQVKQLTYETGEYHFLKVLEINPVAKYAVITTDIRDNVY